MMDVLGHALRLTPPFRGKWRMQRAWERCLSEQEQRTAILPDGSFVRVRMEVPYERMVWLQAEEWDDLRYLQRKLRPGDTFVDVGANVGLWTLVAASTVGPRGRVFSFEPNPTTYARLQGNLTLNQRRDVASAFPHAVSERDGDAHFACTPEHNLSSLSDAADPNTIKVKTVSLDSWIETVPGLDRISGIKLDTEGHELAVLQGASRLLEACSPWLIVEFNTTLLASEALLDWEVYHVLTDLGYRCFTYARTGEETPADRSFSVHGYRNLFFGRNDPK